MMRLFLAIVLLTSSMLLVEAPRPGKVAPFGVAPARAAVPQTFFVKVDGSGSACTQTTPCGSVQSAVDKAAVGDTVYVSGGTHVGTGAAVVSISRGITLAGGWDGVPFGEPVLDADLYPTVLDGEGSRRGVYVGGLAANSPRPRITLNGIVVRRGNATGLGGGTAVSAGADAGGGIYAKGANLVVERCTVADSAASASGDGAGGGLFAVDTDLVVTDSTFRGNTASVTGSGYGGGIAISGGTTVRLSRLRVEDNLAGEASRGVGGGAYILGVAAEFSDSVIRGNTGSSGTGADRLSGQGGGVALQNGQGARILRNVIESNAAAEGAVGDGGGIFVTSSQNVTLAGNVVQSNVASRRGLGQGGGIHVYFSSAASLSGNEVSDNAASETGDGEGGALFVVGSDAALRGEEYYANEAVSKPGAPGGGAAISARGSDVTATNCVFARNGLVGVSDGLFLGDSTVPRVSTLALRFVTLADNGATGLTVAADNGEATLENVIITGQNVGLEVLVSTADVHADHTLWYPFPSLGGRTERIITSHDVVGDPFFVDRTARDYHLGNGSAAIDASVSIGESDDFEGDCRPRGAGYDIGADEFRSAEGAPYCTWRVFLPLVTSR